MSDLTRADLRRFSARYAACSQAGYNYETMQSLGAFYAAGPLIEKMYDDQPIDVVKTKLKALLLPLNCQTTMGAGLLASTLAVESTKEEGCTELATDLRTSLMGPFAGVGDAIFGTLPRVIFAAISAYAALQGNFITGILTCLIGGGIIFAVRWILILTGYYKGIEVITSKREQLNTLRDAASILGIIIVGALIASNVSVTTPFVLTIGEVSQELQSILDSIMPKLLSVVATALVYFGLKIKGMTTVKMVWLIVVVGMALALLGIIA